MSDLIRRTDAIKAVEDLPNAYNGWSDAYDKACIIGTLEEVPSVEPKRGKWIYQFRDSENEEYKCSECDYPTAVKHNYCPNCGASMKGARR